MNHRDKLAALAALGPCSFAELAGTLHALKFTGALTLHFLNGAPQMAELGEPVQIRFPEHPANHMGATGSGGRAESHNSLDTEGNSPPPSSA